MRKLSQAAITGAGTVAACLSGMFSPLIYILIIFEILDYITGITAAVKNRVLSSYSAFWGFIKKLCYFVMICVAFLFDLVITETTARLGIDLSLPEIFGVMSVCYLLSVELISITENLNELGVNIPFVTAALKRYKDKIVPK